jgi:hypothetical protein
MEPTDAGNTKPIPGWAVVLQIFLVMFIAPLIVGLVCRWIAGF